MPTLENKIKLSRLPLPATDLPFTFNEMPIDQFKPILVVATAGCGSPLSLRSKSKSLPLLLRGSDRRSENLSSEKPHKGRQSG
jgi:hypothetical protein